MLLDLFSPRPTLPLGKDDEFGFVPVVVGRLHLHFCEFPIHLVVLRIVILIFIPIEFVSLKHLCSSYEHDGERVWRTKTGGFGIGDGSARPAFSDRRYVTQRTEPTDAFQ